MGRKNKPDYYLYDGLGSVVGLTNEKGSLTTKYSYDEWGVPSPNSRFGQGGARSNTYGFTGEDFDQDTGLLYLRARYYQSDVGRFVSRDPFKGSIRFPQTLQLYQYCLNNPVNLVDLPGRNAKLGVKILATAFLLPAAFIPTGTFLAGWALLPEAPYVGVPLIALGLAETWLIGKYVWPVVEALWGQGENKPVALRKQKS